MNSRNDLLKPNSSLPNGPEFLPYPAGENLIHQRLVPLQQFHRQHEMAFRRVRAIKGQASLFVRHFPDAHLFQCPEPECSRCSPRSIPERKTFRAIHGTRAQPRQAAQKKEAGDIIPHHTRSGNRLNHFHVKNRHTTASPLRRAAQRRADIHACGGIPGRWAQHGPTSPA